MEHPPDWSALEVARVAGRSVLVTCRSRQPLKILNPRAPAGRCHAVLTSYGGGLVAGDFIGLAVGVGPGARLLLTTQANTRVFRSDSGAEARQELAGTVDDGALAVVWPEPVVPQAGSRYRQRQHWHLAPGALLLLADWLHSGRMDSGERFEFTSYASEIKISRAGRLVLLDRFHFQPNIHQATAPAHFGPYQTALSLYLVGDPAARFAALAAALLRLQMAGTGDPHFSLAGRPAIVTVTQVRTDVYVLRALGHTRADLEPVCEQVLAAAFEAMSSESSEQ